LKNTGRHAHLKNYVGGKLELVEADLLKPGSFDHIFKGVDCVMHTASPFKIVVPDPQRDLIEPAVNGTRNVLSAVALHRVPHLVVTSSVAAIVPQVHNFDPNKVWSEEDWNTNSTLTNGPYRLSKTLAERAVWDWGKDHAETHIVTICPSFVLGPVNSARADGESIETLTQMLNGTLKSKGVSTSCFGAVDLRDVAKAHVAAYENRAAHGRYMMSSNEAVPHWQIVQLLKPEFERYPLPDKMNGTIAYWPKYTHAKAEKELGIVFTPIKQSIVDMAQSLIDYGVVPKL